MGFRGRGHDEAVEGLAVSDQGTLVPASASPTSAPRTGNQIAGLRRRLIRRESFRRLWIGQTISVFGGTRSRWSRYRLWRFSYFTQVRGKWGLSQRRAGPRTFWFHSLLEHGSTVDRLVASR